MYSKSNTSLVRLLLRLRLALWVVTSVAHGQASWRSTLYPQNWQPPASSASFATAKLIQDFSYAGYRRGEESIPTVTGPIFDVTSYGADPGGSSDSTKAIQNAINAAAAAGGGIVFLPAGEFRISLQGGQCLTLSSSNIILRGAGTSQTFLLNTSTSMRDKSVVRVGPSSATTGTARAITANLPGPTRRIPVASAGTFSRGNIVRIQWQFTSGWVTENNQQTWWGTSAPANATYLREVTATNAEEGWIEVDVPTRYWIKTRDNPTVRTVSGMLRNVGIESLSIGNLQHPGSGWGEEDYADPTKAAYDAHASWLISIRDTRDSWLSEVHSRAATANTSTCHLLSNGIRLFNCTRITLRNCQMRRPQYGGGGANGYMYRLQNSNECLVRNCIADFSRHGFVISHAGTSGNVFHQCEDRATGRATGSSPSGYITNGAGSDSHQHFSHSNLWDQCHAHNSFYTAHHRMFNGGGNPHGVTSAHAVFWNTTGSGSQYASSSNPIVRSEQLNQGYIIGTRSTDANNAYFASVTTNGNTSPIDHLEGVNTGHLLQPASLYLDQLSLRLRPIIASADSRAETNQTTPISNASTTDLGLGLVSSGRSFRSYLSFDLSGALSATGDTKLTLFDNGANEANTSSVTQTFSLFVLPADWNGQNQPGPVGTVVATVTRTPAIGNETGDLTFASAALTSAFNNALGGTLHLGIRSGSENAAARSFVWFGSMEDPGLEPRLVYTPDYVAEPLLVSPTHPENGATDVLVSARLIATFNKPIALGNGGTITIDDLGGGPDTLITLPDARVSVDGSKLTITPDPPLDPNTSYAIRISGNAVKDQTPIPNFFAGIDDDVTWTFTVTGTKLLPAFDSVARATTATAINKSNPNDLAVGPINGTDYFRTYLSFDLSGASPAAGETSLILYPSGTENNTSSLAQTLTLFVVPADWDGSAQPGPVGTDIATLGFSPQVPNDSRSLRFTSAALTTAINQALGGTLHLGIRSDAEGTDARSFVWLASREDIGQEPRLVYLPRVSGNTFADWIAAQPGVGGLTALTDDPDGDGIANGLENFFGTHPGEFSQGLIAGVRSGDTFTFTHRQGALADDLTQTYRWSTDLNTFHNDGDTHDGTTVSFSRSPDPVVPGVETTVTATVSGDPVDRLFVIVEVAQD
jgi:hypothetical protein